MASPGSPVLRITRYGESTFKELIAATEREGGRAEQLLLEYPTVYIVTNQKPDGYDVYIGETNSIQARTSQHLAESESGTGCWKHFKQDGNSALYIIGHEMFNKSLTLDVEDRLMLYLTSTQEKVTTHNKRGNPQNDYYTREELDEVFRRIWMKLRREDSKFRQGESRLFPKESIVQQSALFRASPYHKLTKEQFQAKDKIVTAIDKALRNKARGQLVLVEGEAGSGKTVLLSSIFFDLVRGEENPGAFDFQNWDAHLVVNHKEQETVYREIARRLGVLRNQSEERVGRPTRFINNHSPDSPVDVVLVDEAHLLWTQGKQSYRGKNQLKDLIQRAKVVVAVFDPKQIMATNAYWEDNLLQEVRASASEHILLEQQMRIASSSLTLEWLRTFIDGGKLEAIPEDPSYDLKIFDSPHELHEAIKSKAKTEEEGISRLLATFDWPYSSGYQPEEDYWRVNVDHLDDTGRIQTFSIPWNLQLPYQGKRGQRNHLSWAEQPQTLEECGSHFTVQGLDLNYAGVILGPSVGYENGRLIFRTDKSFNKHATQKRTLSDKSKVSVAEELLRNELNVLLTRGVHGLYIYAVDPALREALLSVQEEKQNNVRH